MSNKFVIVGAGPVGLTMAAALANQGIDCRIVDKTEKPTDKSKALVVWSRTLELLDGLGLAPSFVHAGLKMKGVSIYGDGNKVVDLELEDADSPYGFPLTIPQNETERLLIEHLAKKGISVERNVELVSFTEEAGVVTGKLRHADGKEETFQTPWLLGCDGAHSKVRHTLGIEFTGKAEPNDWTLDDVHIEGSLAMDETSVFWHKKGILIFFPIARDRVRVVLDLGMSAPGDLLPEPTLEEVQAKVDERGPGGLKLKDPVWLSNFRINERKVSVYYRGRVLLAGDAAHIHSPAGGQGMNTGMQDAFNAAWKLALIHRGEGQTKALLDSYTAERSEVGDQVLKGAGMVTLIGTLRNPVAQFFRNHIASVLTSFQFVKDKIRNAAMELSINYRHSPLSKQDMPWLAGGLHVGDRMPDAELSNETGRTTLFAAIRGIRHTLLLLPGAKQSASLLIGMADEVSQAFPNVFAPHVILSDSTPGKIVPTVPVWHDEGGAFHKKLGVSGNAMILVRPDGYIGYRCQPADGEALKNYLSTYLIAKS